MTEPVIPRPGSQGMPAALLAAGALVFALLVALGIWQMERLAWKEALIARVDARLRAAPVAAPEPPTWQGLGRESHEYLRVQLHGHFANALETTVHATTELGPGYWVLTPLLTDKGFWVLINRGFVPAELRESASRPAASTEDDETVIGLLRFSEPRGSLLQKNAADRWYSRDVAAIAAQRGLGTPGYPGLVAPYFVDAGTPGEAPAGAESWPRPGLTVVQFRNNHLVYALTWFGLAAMLAGVMGYLWVDERRLRRRNDPDALAEHRLHRI